MILVFVPFFLLLEYAPWRNIFSGLSDQGKVVYPLDILKHKLVRCLEGITTLTCTHIVIIMFDISDPIRANLYGSASLYGSPIWTIWAQFQRAAKHTNFLA